jgi:hypothetical protein
VLDEGENFRSGIWERDVLRNKTAESQSAQRTNARRRFYSEVSASLQSRGAAEGRRHLPLPAFGLPHYSFCQSAQERSGNRYCASGGTGAPAEGTARALACERPRVHLSPFPKGLMKPLWPEPILQMHFSEKPFHLKSLNKARRLSKGF